MPQERIKPAMANKWTSHLTTSPRGLNPCLSKNKFLSLKLMNSCVVRVFGPAVAKTTVPRLFVTRTGSSRRFWERHLAWTSGLYQFVVRLFSIGGWKHCCSYNWSFVDLYQQRLVHVLTFHWFQTATQTRARHGILGIHRRKTIQLMPVTKKYSKRKSWVSIKQHKKSLKRLEERL